MKRDTIAAAHGRWREILTTVGISETFLTGKPGPCPMCGGNDRWTYTDRNKEGDHVCRRCGAGKGMQLVMKFTGWDFKRAAEEVDRIVGNLPPVKAQTEFHHAEANPGALRRMWGASKCIEADDPAGMYLHSRRLTLDGVRRGALHYAPELKFYRDGSIHPGMLAVFSHPSGAAATIHRTFLTRDGKKAALDPNRMFMPGKIPDGGAIRLYEAAEHMGVAEGIETAISASLMSGIPVWATTSDGALTKWQPPAIAKRIAIFGDNDLNFVGQAAAYALAKRLMLEAQRDGIERMVDVMVPTMKGTDWNDELEREGEFQCAQ